MSDTIWSALHDAVVGDIDVDAAVVVEQTHAAGHALGQIEPLVVPDVGLEINSACQCDFLRTTTLLVKSQPSRRFEVLLSGSTKQRHTNAGEQHGDFDWFGSVMLGTTPE